MGMLTEKRTMHVDEVNVINGQAGDDWLYEVALSDRSGGHLVITDWGRDLKVPRAGADVEVKAAHGTWAIVDNVLADHALPQLSGLSRISGELRGTGYVGLMNYHDRGADDKKPELSNSISIQTTALRWFDALTAFLDPANWGKKDSGAFIE